jgi:DNA-binding transcriptional regulator YiaG
MALEEELVRLRTCSTSEVCHYLGMKVRRLRQDLELSQVVFAAQVGVPLRTYKRFESHGRANLETFIRVLRALERTDYLFMLFPQRTKPGSTTSEKLRAARARASGLG